LFFGQALFKIVGSMDKIAAVIAKEHAQLWINHDQPQSDAQKKLPAYYE
jgi:N-acyl homoserine lactone hydrolase